MSSATSTVVAGVEASHACAILTSRLASFGEAVACAAARATAEWEGPHRVRFDDDARALLLVLDAAASGVLRLRWCIDGLVADAQVERQRELGAVSTSGPR